MAPFITAVYSFSLVKEDRHIVSLGLSLLRLPAMSILRVVGASPDLLWLPRTMIAANSHAERGWVHALGPPRLALGCAALGLA